jgi:hypothetical protein
MRAAAHDPAFAKKMNIPQSVARDFFAADQRKARLKSIKRAFDGSPLRYRKLRK